MTKKRRLPKKQDDEIRYQSVVSQKMPEFRPEMPAEWTIPVSDSNTMAEFRSSVRAKIQRRKKIGIVLRLVYNGGVSVLARVSGVPELNHLKLNKEDIKMKPIKKRISLKLQSTKESIAWFFVLVVFIGGYFGFDWSQADIAMGYDLVAVAIGAVLAAYYFLKDLFVRED